MAKLSLYPLILGSIVLAGSPVLGSNHKDDDVRRTPARKVLLNLPLQPKPTPGPDKSIATRRVPPTSAALTPPQPKPAGPNRSTATRRVPSTSPALTPPQPKPALFRPTVFRVTPSLQHQSTPDKPAVSRGIPSSQPALISVPDKPAVSRGTPSSQPALVSVPDKSTVSRVPPPLTFTQTTPPPKPSHIPSRAPDPTPPRTATEQKKPNPFLKRLTRTTNKQKEEIALYPQGFNAHETQLFINAPAKYAEICMSPVKRESGEKVIPSEHTPRYDLSKKQAVALYIEGFGRAKVSVKSPIGWIKAAIEAGGSKVSLTAEVSKDITVPESRSLKFPKPAQLDYNGGTAQEETRKTGKVKRGTLIEYQLMFGEERIQYQTPDSLTYRYAKVILSITKL